MASDNQRNQRRGGRGHSWSYKASREAIALAGIAQYRGSLLDGPVWVRMDFYLPNNRRTDCSNRLKVIFDGLNGVIWKDDSLIKDMGYLVHSPDGSEPRVEIRVGTGIHREE